MTVQRQRSSIVPGKGITESITSNATATLLQADAFRGFVKSFSYCLISLTIPLSSITCPSLLAVGAAITALMPAVLPDILLLQDGHPLLAATTPFLVLATLFLKLAMFFLLMFDCR